ncbi:MAG: HDOD domain-containing protein [Gammaproteobacteria bacterium]|nr:HDOD domain-containing protein [Gammaproteobacteria bacterium]
MAVRDDLQLGRELLREQEAPPVAVVNPTFEIGAGRSVDAAEIVVGLARELNTDKIELPGFPDIVVRIQRLLADEGSSARDVVKLVASEPALAARLVQLANSAAFNRSRREVSDLKAAINALGFNLVRSQATAFAMRQMEKEEWLRPIRPILADIWKTSNGVAALSFAVARHVPGVQPDESMSAGLFHLIGKLYLFARARQDNIEPAAIADWEGALNEWHATIARTILDHWKIPERIAEAVENQNAIFEVDSRELSPLTRILCAAKLHYRLRQAGHPPDPEAEAALASVVLNGKPFAEIVAAAQKDIEAARSEMK